jgi:hypothetical protein
MLYAILQTIIGLLTVIGILIMEKLDRDDKRDDGVPIIRPMTGYDQQIIDKYGH